jgi:hypothetical protein
VLNVLNLTWKVSVCTHIYVYIYASIWYIKFIYAYMFIHKHIHTYALQVSYTLTLQSQSFKYKAPGFIMRKPREINFPGPVITPSILILFSKSHFSLKEFRLLEKWLISGLSRGCHMCSGMSFHTGKSKIKANMVT